jgi:hypothetical protein
MFRKLIILFGLLVAPAFGQELPPPIQDPIATQTYTLTVIPGTQLDNIQQTGTAANLGDDSTLTGVSIGFDFYYYGNLYNTVNLSQNGFISFTSLANGCCSGQPLPNFSELIPGNEAFYNYYNTHNTIFAMWSDLISFTGNPYYQSFGDKFTVGWYDVEELGSYRQNCAFDLFGLPLFCNNVGPNRFDFEITLHSNNDIAIRYGNFDNPVNTGRPITSGIQGDQPGEFWQIYFGSDTNTLEGKTYVFNSSEIVPIAPIAPDCTLNPTDPTCIINDITDDFTEVAEEPTYLANEETGSDDGSDDGTEVIEEDEEELLADEDMTDEELLEEVLDEEQLVADEETSEEQLEELLAEIEEESDSFAEPAVVATYRELSDEEKAAILADAISKNTLESALSIAAEATTSTSTVASNAESTASSTSARSSNESSSSTTTVSEESTLLADDLSQQNEETATSDDALDILETGRQLGQQALSETLAASENASNESLAEAESIASSSSEASASQQSVVAINDTQSTDVNSSVTEQQTTETQVVSVIQEDTTQQEVTVADTNTETNVDMGMPTDTNTIDSTSQIVEEANMLADNLLRGPEVESTEIDEALAIVEASRATSEQKTFDDESNKDAEVTTAMVDPALAMANTFNQAPSMMSLEFLGIVKPVEEKSDAEIRAEQVVAANKEEQDKINSNYMDADQSGIVAAIAVDADVTSYLSARLADNNTWYKPEDIYKGVVIKDNARGSYFLEKGNTDTYKKMVDEQYK